MTQMYHMRRRMKGGYIPSSEGTQVKGKPLLDKEVLLLHQARTSKRQNFVDPVSLPLDGPALSILHGDRLLDHKVHE